MNARNKLLENLRQRLNVASNEESRLAAVRSRLTEHPRNTIPSRGKQDHSELIVLFGEMLTSVQGTFDQVSEIAAIPGAVESYLNKHSLGKEVCLDHEVRGLGINWSKMPELEILEWQAKQNISVGITNCLGAVAETGSLVVCSSDQHAITMNFLCETNIVILKAQQLVGTYEEIWSILRNNGLQFMPRDLTLISSPSCTGDIEMMIEYGAHGPKHLHVILVDTE